MIKTVRLADIATRAVKENCFSMLEVIAGFDEDALVALSKQENTDGLSGFL